MGFIARQYDTSTPFTDAQALEALERVAPADLIQAAAAAAAVPTQRRRKLPTDVTLLLCRAMRLFTAHALDVVLATMTHGLRLLWPAQDPVLATKGAIAQARYRLGARPVVALFHQVCQPLATVRTPGAFLCGLRVMASDGTTEDVPDSPANVRAFGRQHGDRGDSAFPQVQGVYLSECGTPAVIDAVFWPCRIAARVGALRLLRRVGAGLLVLLDRGFDSFEMIARTRATGAHVLGRVPAHVILTPRQVLPAGSYWAYIYPADRERRKRGDHRLVRVIVYTRTDPARPGCGETHRLVTTLLDAHHAPAFDLIVAYHERGAIERTSDEIDTHQRLVRHPLRSQKPVGVIQELYGLLIAHYAVRALMAEAAATVDRAPTRLSFVHAVDLIRVALDDFQLVPPAQHDLLSQRLLRDIAACRLPDRAPRTNPRVVKRKMSKFRLKRGSPLPAAQHLGAFADAVHILPHAAPDPYGLDDPPPLDDALDTACPLLYRI